MFFNFFFSSISFWNLENRDMWEKSMKGLSSLIRRSTPSSFTYICEKNGGSLTDKVWYCTYNICIVIFSILPYDVLSVGIIFHSTEYLQMDELACFAPGMIALGSFGYSADDDSQKFLSLAEEVYFDSLFNLINPSMCLFCWLTEFWSWSVNLHKVFTSI